jgi:ATP synthase protein I
MTDDKGGSFDERLRAARTKQALDVPPPSAGTGTTSPMGIGVRVGVELVSALAVSVAIGWGLDWWLGTKPWLTGLFVLLGGAAGIANVWRLMMPRVPRA